MSSWPYHIAKGSASHGAPANVTEALALLLADGEYELTPRRSNRELSFSLIVEGNDLAELAENEAALMREADKPRSTLTFYPGDDVGLPTVFDTFRASVVAEHNAAWDASKVRRYHVTVRALPYPKSSTPVEVSALAAGTGTSASVDDGLSATGWSITDTPVVRTNLVPNGSFETGGGTTGWTTGSGTSGIGVAGGGGTDGVNRLVVTASGTQPRSYINSSKMPCTAGLPYATQLQMRTFVGTGHREGVLVRFYNSSGAQILDVVHTASATNDTWVKRSWVDTAPAGAVEVSLHPFYETTSGANIVAGRDWSIDAVMVEQSATVGTYFNGATTDTATVTYDWSGTAHNSTSTGTYSQTLAVASGAVQATRYGANVVTLRRTGAVSPGATPYLRLNGTVLWDVAAPKTTGLTLAFKIDGTTVAPALLTITGSTWSAVIYRPANFTTLDVTATAATATAENGVRVAVDQITRADRAVDSTGRQTQRIIPVYGSMRTEASIEVLGLDAAGTAAVALGAQTLVYAAPAAADGTAPAPDLRRYRSAGPTVTADTAMVSGARETLTTSSTGATTFTIPASQIPEGTYALYAKLAASAAGTFTVNWSATVATAFASHTLTGSGSVALTTAHQIVPVGLPFTLPPAALDPAASGNVTFTVWVGSGTITLDEAWLFDIDAGQVSLVDTSGGVEMLRIDAATIDRPDPSYWIGSALTEANTINAGQRVQAFTQHLFPPGSVSVFTVTTSATTARVSLGYWPRWHTHAGAVPA